MFLLLPMVLKSIGCSQYNKATELGEKVGEVSSRGLDPESTVIPEENVRETELLASRRERAYQRVVIALSLARRLRGSTLDDQDLVLLASARLGALGNRHPPLHTIGEVKEGLKLAEAELEEALRLNPKNKEAFSVLIHVHLGTPFSYREADRRSLTRFAGSLKRPFPMIRICTHPAAWHVWLLMTPNPRSVTS